MNLGFASPVSLQLLRHLVANGENMPPGYQFGPSADWIQELMKRGHHVTVYTTSREIDTPKTFCGESIRIRIASQRLSGCGRDLFAVEREQLKQMMAADRCQLIHAHWTYQFALAALASGLPTLITIHDHPWKVLGYFRDMHRVARLMMAYEVAWRGKHFTAVSEGAARHFQRYLKPGMEIAVVPNGLPDAVFALAREPLRNSRNTTVFATILQGWSRQKNPKVLLKSFARVQREMRTAQLLMFGVDYEQGGPAERWAIEHGLAENISFVGSVPYHELLERIAYEADVIVHPSINETFSMTVLEAMALKKPVIAGEATAGMNELLESGKSGILLDVRRPEAIGNAMLRLAREKSYRDKVANRGYERAWSLYRLKRTMALYECAYNQLT